MHSLKKKIRSCQSFLPPYDKRYLFPPMPKSWNVLEKYMKIVHFAESFLEKIASYFNRNKVGWRKWFQKSCFRKWCGSVKSIRGTKTPQRLFGFLKGVAGFLVFLIGSSYRWILPLNWSYIVSSPTFRSLKNWLWLHSSSSWEIVLAMFSRIRKLEVGKLLLDWKALLTFTRYFHTSRFSCHVCCRTGTNYF